MLSVANTGLAHKGTMASGLKTNSDTTLSLVKIYKNWPLSLQEPPPGETPSMEYQYFQPLLLGPTLRKGYLLPTVLNL